jgi:hypothetical protein
LYAVHAVDPLPEGFKSQVKHMPLFLKSVPPKASLSIAPAGFYFFFAPRYCITCIRVSACSKPRHGEADLSA